MKLIYLYLSIIMSIVALGAVGLMLRGLTLVFLGKDDDHHDHDEEESDEKNEKEEVDLPKYYNI